MADITISRMTTEDTESAAVLEKQCFSSPWSKQALDEACTHEAGVFFVASDGGFCGHSGMVTVLDQGQICNIAVVPEKRGMGIGKMLTQALIDHGVAHGLSCIMLEVRASNAVAISMYESLGFVRVGVSRNHYSKPREDAYLYNYYIN